MKIDSINFTSAHRLCFLLMGEREKGGRGKGGRGKKRREKKEGKGRD